MRSECKTLRITLSYPTMSRPVSLYLAAPKMADKHDRDSSPETESDSGDRNDVKMREMSLERKTASDHNNATHNQWEWEQLVTRAML